MSELCTLRGCESFSLPHVVKSGVLCNSFVPSAPEFSSRAAGSGHHAHYPSVPAQQGIQLCHLAAPGGRFRQGHQLPVQPPAAGRGAEGGGGCLHRCAPHSACASHTSSMLSVPHLWCIPAAKVCFAMTNQMRYASVLGGPCHFISGGKVDGHTSRSVAAEPYPAASISCMIL